jgi:hypothetical protein
LNVTLCTDTLSEFNESPLSALAPMFNALSEFLMDNISFSHSITASREDSMVSAADLSADDIRLVLSGWGGAL